MAVNLEFPPDQMRAMTDAVAAQCTAHITGDPDDLAALAQLTDRVRVERI